MSYKFDDEDGPITFERNSMSKSNELHSKRRKLTSHCHDGQSYKKTSDVPSSNGECSSSQNGKVVPSAKASSVESLVGISKASTSNLKTYTRSSSANSNSTNHLKEDKCENSEDEEDKIPLRARMKMNNDNAKKATPNVSTLSVKRPLDKLDSLHSSGKKAKLSDLASSINARQISAKSEPQVEEEEDDDDIPLSLVLNNLAILVDNKSSSLKKFTKVNKGAAPSFKEKEKLKKSEHLKSTKLQQSSGDGQKKWTTFVHNGIIFPPPYKPHGVKILCKGKPVTLTPEQEEVATWFADMEDTEYMQKEIFKNNFWNDWQKLLGKNHVIQNLKDCDFTPIYDWCQIDKDKKKQMSSAEKKALREDQMKQEEKYKWAIVDGVKEKVGNFRVEPPGLFRGRGKHPKTGHVKKRIRPKDVIINIGKDAPIPECPIPGER